jgi:hypothetical protein
MAILGANKSPVNQTVSVLNQAGAKYGVPPALLFGVWGMETSFGSNVTTSPTGAEGDFQFEPATASSYGYPLTNSPTMAQFAQQADAAARYLSDLFKRTGSWDAALKAYSGGGYGLSQVQAKAGAGPGNNLGGIDIPGAISGAASGVTGAVSGAADSVGSAAGTLGSAANSLGSVVGFLTSPTNWLRIGEVIVGVLLILMGLRSLSGNSVSPSDLAAAAAVVK